MRLKACLGGRPQFGWGGYFYEGNKYALAESMAPESHKRRVKALYRGWGTLAKKHAGEIKVTPNQQRKKAKRQRARLKMTVAREQREIQEIARKGAEAVMRRMQEIAETSFNETAAIAAGQVVLERAYGKANQTNINATVDANGKPTDVSAKELDTRIEKTLKRVAELTGGAPKAPESKKQPVDLRKLDRDPNSTPLN